MTSYCQMYQLNDTITAVSSPSSQQRVIIRMAGPRMVETINHFFKPAVKQGDRGIISAKVAVDAELTLDAKVYLFSAPHSYTGQTLAEIHIDAGASVTEALMQSFLAGGVRMAGPGEFTARRFLNGRIDLAQAEAVNEIIASSNRFQLAAAEKLLAGRLAETTAKIRSAIMNCLSRIEAAMDFSGEDIEFITVDEALAALQGITAQLEQLLADSIGCESVLDLPAVGIAGAANAGKSSLLNSLLGRQRSIVSPQRKTTRDVLTGLLKLNKCRCVLFDCAGLVLEPCGILDRLAQAAAIEALRKALLVVFCVDVSKSDWSEDVQIRRLLEQQNLIAVATKSDLLGEDLLAERISSLTRVFGTEFLPTSSKTDSAIGPLREQIDEKIVELTAGPGRLTKAGFSEAPTDAVALTARHRQAVTEAIENISEAVMQLKAGSDEIAAMMLRTAYQALANIEQHHVDEQILEQIFSRFCIGK